MRRDKTSQIRARIGNLAARAALLPQTLVTTLLEGGANAYDGIAFFGDRTSVKTGGQIDNRISVTAAAGTDPTSDEMKTGILDAIEKLYEAKDDEDEPMHEFATSFLVMVPPNYWGAMVAALKDEFTSAGVSNTLTAVTGSGGFTITPVMNPRIASDTKFFLFRTDSDVKPFIWQDEQSTDLDELGSGSDYEFFNRAHVFGATRLGNCGFGEPAMAIEATVA